MRKYYLPSAAFALAGIVCAVLRRIIVSQAFDSHNLPIKGFWAITVVNILVVLMTAFAIFIAHRITKEYEVLPRYSLAFQSKSLVVIILKLAATLAFIIGAVLVITETAGDISGKTKLVQLIAFCVTAVIGAFAFLRQTRAAATGKNNQGDAYLGAFAAFALAFRILTIYFDNTANPVIISYSFDCIALSASCLFVFLAAGWFTGKIQPFSTIVCGLEATLFCLAGTIGNTVCTGDKIICLSVGVYSTICTMSFLKNLKQIKRVF